ncbi:hypothetical protein [Mesorhizobium sp.]|uniref:hypothetical protein n=1 Tax=Mesorhizobium sp. TaxID=1871066 RepID=UPI000FE76574|nr:hypothetical protein [Mesorhizobium sp.]RWJ52646.1 MAG: hypothetical protein EOR31_06385 [Mesorhizobium sp.]
MTRFVEEDDNIETADPHTSPASSDYASIAFPLNEQAAVDAFNAVFKAYLGSYKMTKRSANTDKWQSESCEARGATR